MEGLIKMKRNRILTNIGWGLLMLSATAIALLSLRFLLPNPPNVGPEIAINFNANKTIFLGHVVGSLIALLVGPWQFLSSIRNKWPALHRTIGKIYIAGVAVGGVSGFVVAWTSVAGPIATAGFALLAVLWLVFTALALQKAMSGQFEAHRTWMIRSFALTAAAITLRMGLPIAPALGYSFMAGYITMSWAAWLINLGIAEVILRKGNKKISLSRPMVEAA
jgi:uncharacterized membrane protein